MPSTRAQQAQILRNSSVLDQLTGALLAAAQNVANEAATTANHANRAAYANAILANPTAQAQFMMPAILSNATLSAAAGNAAGPSGTQFVDGDIDFLVASVFDVYANQYAEQKASGALLKIVS